MEQGEGVVIFLPEPSRFEEAGLFVKNDKLGGLCYDRRSNAVSIG